MDKKADTFFRFFVITSLFIMASFLFLYERNNPNGFHAFEATFCVFWLLGFAGILILQHRISKRFLMLYSWIVAILFAAWSMYRYLAGASGLAQLGWALYFCSIPLFEIFRKRTEKAKAQNAPL